MATSQNRYIANDRTRVESMLIPGTSRRVTVRKGAPGVLLCHWAAWFDKNIESIDNDGQLDDWGYAERTVRGSSTTLSNHASGTAIDLNAPEHWLGARGTFTPEQTRKIRTELKKYEGAIRWGGDYKNRADEMHFEIMAAPEECARILRKLKTQQAPAAARPPAPAETLNPVQQGRVFISQGLAEFAKAKDRPVVRAQAAIMKAALAIMPKQ